MLQFQVNKNTSGKRGATMIELMAMLAIVGLGLGSMFSVITSGIYFAKDTEDTIRAINLAREGIEGVTNIRNTNWLRFSSDRQNCWNSSNYDAFCIGNAVSGDRLGAGQYTLYTTNGLWYLSGSTVIDPDSNWTGYASAYRAIQDDTSFFNQTGSATVPCNTAVQKNCVSLFTREIILTVPAYTGTIYVKSIVRWNTKQRHKVELETTLTNWKSKF